MDLLKNFIACPGRCSEFSAHDESRLLDENVYIEFKGKIKESNKLFSLRKIQYIDVVRDVCVLELLVFDYCNLPPPFTEFCHPTTDSSLTFIGYGHPSHNLKTIEPKVRVLNLQSKRVENYCLDSKQQSPTQKRFAVYWKTS